MLLVKLKNEIEKMEKFKHIQNRIKQGWWIQVQSAPLLRKQRIPVLFFIAYNWTAPSTNRLLLARLTLP
jgi:hypothetical protein